MSAPALPPNALDDARTLLHEQLRATLEAVGWTADRADRYPLLTPRVPSGWVDAATMSAQGNGLVATFPLGFAVDGNDAEQVKRLDAILAILWARLEAVKVPAGLLLPAGSTLQVMTAGPAEFEIGGGPTTRALALTVQVPIGPRTLCPTALTGDLE